MLNPPRTRAEAEKRRYGMRPGHEAGHTYDSASCAWHTLPRYVWGGQCSRKPGHGPGEMYCRQHAKMVGAGK